VGTFARAHRFAEYVLDLPVDAAQLIGGPALQIGPQAGIDAEQELLALSHQTAPQ